MGSQRINTTERLFLSFFLYERGLYWREHNNPVHRLSMIKNNKINFYKSFIAVKEIHLMKYIVTTNTYKQKVLVVYLRWHYLKQKFSTNRWGVAAKEILFSTKSIFKSCLRLKFCVLNNKNLESPSVNSPRRNFMVTALWFSLTTKTQDGNITFHPHHRMEWRLHFLGLLFFS